MAQRDLSQGWGFVYLSDNDIKELIKQSKQSRNPIYPPTTVKSVNLHKSSKTPEKPNI